MLERLSLHHGLEYFCGWKTQLFDFVKTCGLEWDLFDFPVEKFLESQLYYLLVDRVELEHLDFGTFAQELYKFFGELDDQDKHLEDN